MIFLTGMPGAGKTTVGAALADLLGYRFVDLDSEIEQQAGKPIPQIFAEDGEDAFRDLESSALENLSTLSEAVVALGAGALQRPENVAAVTRGTLIYLRANLELLEQRVQSDSSSRPLLSDAGDGVTMRSRLERLREKREPGYLAASLILDVNRSQPPAVLASELKAMLRRNANR